MTKTIGLIIVAAIFLTGLVVLGNINNRGSNRIVAYSNPTEEEISRAPDIHNECEWHNDGSLLICR